MLFLRICALLSLGGLRLLATTAAETGPDPFAGIWLGSVTAPNAQTEIGFAFRPTARGLLTQVHLPAMFLWGTPLGPAKVENGTLTIGPLSTQLTRRGEHLVGTFGLSRLPVELHRATSLPPAPPPEPPAPIGPAPKWTTHLEGEIWATPLVHREVVLLGTTAGMFYALDHASGAIRWQHKGPAAVYGTALAAANRVCFVDARQHLVALHLEDGSPVWDVALHDESLAGAPLPANPTYNHRTATPVWANGLLYLGSSDGGIYAIDPASGHVHWRHQARAPIFATAGLDPSSGELLFAAMDGSVIALDPRTRRETSRTRLPGAVSSTPVRLGNSLIVGCRDYMLYGLQQDSLAIAWRYSFWFSWIESTPAVRDGTVYIGGSDFARVTALDPASGRAHWSTVVNGLTWGTPIVTAASVFVGTSSQRDAIIAHVGSIVALNRSNGAIRWRHPLPGADQATRAGVIGSLALDGDNLIAATFDGTVLALPQDDGAR